MKTFDLGTTGAVLGIGPEDENETIWKVGSFTCICFTIQIVLLYYMAELLDSSRETAPPLLLMLVAVFLHVLHTSQPIINGCKLVKTLTLEEGQEDDEDAQDAESVQDPSGRESARELRTVGSRSSGGSGGGGGAPSEKMVEQLKISYYYLRTKSVIIVLDTIILPLVVMFIGGLFVFLSPDVEALILNSVAVAFITQVDELLWNSAAASLYVQLEELELWPFHDEPSGFKMGKGCALSVAEWVSDKMLAPPLIPVLITAGVWALATYVV